MLSTFLILFFIFILISSIFRGEYFGQSYPNDLKIIISPPNFLEVGETSRKFVAKISDQNKNPIEGLTIFIRIESLTMYFFYQEYNCDDRYLARNYWNIIYINNLGPCSIELKGEKQKTDQTGFAYFENFKFNVAPEGSYNIYLEVLGSNLVSDLFHILISPSVYSIESLNNPPLTARINEPLDPQPQLRVYDKYNSPIANKVVYAVSRPYSDFFQERPQLFDPDNDKFAYFENSRSLPSDKDGKLNFSELKIIGSTHKNAYIRFVAEGIGISCPWSKFKFPIINPYYYPNIYIKPIEIISSQNHHIVIIQEIEKSIVEGREFEFQPKINIFDDFAKPISGLMCFALVKKFNQMYYPIGYAPTEYMTFPKSIVKMSSGKYPKCENVSSKCYLPKVSDIYGNIEFEGLAISQSGSNYKYTNELGIEFHCGNAKSNLALINIFSSVKTIQFIDLPNFMDQYNSYGFTLSTSSIYSIRILDSQNYPISNKIVNKLLLVEQNSRDSSKVLIKNVQYFQSYKYGHFNISLNSNKYGIIIADIYIFQALIKKGFFYFSVIVDGIEVTSAEPFFLIIDQNKDNKCNLLIPSNNTYFYSLNNSDQINFELFFYNFTGSQYMPNKRNLTFSFFSPGFINALFFQDMDISNLQYKFDRLNLTYRLLFNESSLKITNFNLKGLFSGSYFSYISIYTNYEIWNVYDDEINTCTNSFPMVFHYFNSVSKVIILNLPNNRTILLNSFNLTFSLLLRIEENSGNSLKNFPIATSLNIYHYPKIYSYKLFKNEENLKKVLRIMSFSNQTSTEGIVAIEFELNYSYIGDMAFGIVINGISSDPINLKMQSEFRDITIIYSPNNKTNYSLLSSMNDLFVIQLSSSDTKQIANIPIIAFFSSLEVETFIDVFTDNNSSVVFNPNRVSLTNSSGSAIFQDLRLLGYDNIDLDSIKGYFYFKVGINTSVVTNASPIYFFYNPNLKLYSTENNDYEFFFSDYLINPILVKLEENPNFPFMNIDHPLVFSIILVKYDENQFTPNQGFVTTFFLFTNTICNLKKFENSDLNCNFSSNSFNPIDGVNLYKIRFSWVYYSSFSGLKKFDFVTCIYNYCNHTSNTLSGFKLSNYDKDFIFVSQFPEIIDIGEMATMKLRPFFYDSSITYLTIHCNILSRDTLSVSNSTLSSIIQTLSERNNEPDLFNLLSEENTGIGINTIYSKTVSDNFGWAQMIFEFISGKSGYYSIECQTEYGYRFFSNTFYIYNSIKKINIISNEEYEFYQIFQQISGTILPLNFTLSNLIKLEIITDNYLTPSNIKDLVKVKLYRQDAYRLVLNLAESDLDSVSKLQSFWNLLTQGTSSLIIDKSGYIFNVNSFDIKFTGLFFEISNQALQIPEPNIYRLRYVCLGIKSKFSGPIYIKGINYSSLIEFIVYYKEYFFIPVLIFIILTNSIHFSNWTLIISSILLIIIMVIYGFSYKTLFGIIFGESLLIINLFILIFQIVLYIRFNNLNTFSQIRDERNKTFSRKLFKNLIHSKRRYVSFESKNKDRFFLKNSISVTNKSITHLVNVSKIKGELRASKSKNHFKIATFIEEIINLFRIFSQEPTYYYPQRFLMGICFSLFTLIFCVFQVTTYIFYIISSLSYLKNVIASIIFSFINYLIEIMATTMNYILTNEDLEIYYSLINQFMSIFNELENTIKISLIISNIFVCLIFICSISWLIILYKRMVIRSRKSNIILLKLKASNDISNASDFAGLIMGNTAISYIMVTSLLTIILGAIINKYFWLFIWRFRISLLFILLPVIIQFIIDLVIKRILYKNNLVIRVYLLLQFYDIFLIISSILQGIVSSFSRILLGFVSFFIGLIRFDKSILPKWISLLLLKDDTSESFYSLILIHICYLNPIFCEYSNLFKGIKKGIVSRSLRLLWVGYFLSKFPFLCKERKKRNVFQFVGGTL